MMRDPNQLHYNDEEFMRARQQIMVGRLRENWSPLRWEFHRRGFLQGEIGVRRSDESQLRTVVPYAIAVISLSILLRMYLV